MHCWFCERYDFNEDQGDEVMSDNPEYAQGYLEGYSDAEKHYTNKCILCGTGGTVSWLCNECKDKDKD